METFILFMQSVPHFDAILVFSIFVVLVPFMILGTQK
jgi:hypothetical protein